MSTTEVEARARTMGWLPKDQFKGKPESWRPAEEYISKGEEILPMLRANNKKLSEEVAHLQTELQTTKQLLQTTTESIDELKKFNTDIAQNNAKAKKAQLLAAIKEAKTEGDTDREVQLTDQLSELNITLRESATKPVVKTIPTLEQPTLSGDAKQWLADNQWFGSDKRRTGFAFGVAEELKAKGYKAGSIEFYEEIGKAVDEQFGDQRRRAEPKVGSTNGGSAASDTEGKTFADLPADAREVCNKQAAKQVGTNKLFKTQDEWRAYYVAKYFE